MVPHNSKKIPRVSFYLNLENCWVINRIVTFFDIFFQIFIPNFFQINLYPYSLATTNGISFDFLYSYLDVSVHYCLKFHKEFVYTGRSVTLRLQLFVNFNVPNFFEYLGIHLMHFKITNCSYQRSILAGVGFEPTSLDYEPNKLPDYSIPHATRIFLPLPLTDL